jgi:hypothetical protein
MWVQYRLSNSLQRKNENGVAQGLGKSPKVKQGFDNFTPQRPVRDVE